MSELEDQLKRAHYDFEEEPTEVISLIDYPDLRFDGNHYILIKDEKVFIPLWIAEVLEDKGLVKIPVEESDLYKELDNILTVEGGSKLSEVDSHLYRRVRKEIKQLQKSNSPNSLIKLSAIEANFDAILRRRARKIVAFYTFKKNHSETTHERQIPTEEKWLLRRFNEIYTIWNEEVGKDSIDHD